MESNKASTGPRAAPLLNRFPNNARKDLLPALLADLWTSLVAHLADPIRIEEDGRRREVIFMGAARYTAYKRPARILVSALTRQGANLAFVDDHTPTVIDLPARLNGFWLDAFLAPWEERIAECLIDHEATGSDLDWNTALKLELQRALKRATYWYAHRCRLRDALELDPKVIAWCRKGRATSRNYVTQRQYNAVLATRSTYRRIERDNPNLVCGSTTSSAAGLARRGGAALPGAG